MNSVQDLSNPWAKCQEKTKVLARGKWIKEKKEYLKENKIYIQFSLLKYIRFIKFEIIVVLNLIAIEKDNKFYSID